MLSQYKSEYLGNGWHDVVVGKPELFEAKTGTPGLNFTLRGDAGTTKIAFFLTEAALWRLASFAEACGLTVDQLKTYDEKNPNSHNLLIGKRVKVLVEPARNPKYHEATEWMNPADPTPMPTETTAAPMNEPPPAPAPTPVAAPPDDDDVPF